MTTKVSDQGVVDDEDLFLVSDQGVVDDEDLFKLVDLLQREQTLPGDIDQSLDVSQHHGQFPLCPTAAALP